jgi:two-component system, NtrC family, response regulator AtoC
MRKVRVLVVDGEETSRRNLKRFFEKKGWLVECVGRADEALERLTAAPPSFVVADVTVPGISALQGMRAIAPEAQLIAVSVSAHARTMLRATQLKAVDYLIKPLRDEDLEEVLQNLTWVEPSNPPLRESVPNGNGISDASLHPSHPCFNCADPKLLRIAEIAARVAQTDVPVLISGESGVGKGVLANYIHNSSSRRDHAFVKVNCAALPWDLLESELFGYERGAFTGAVDKKPGKFELANGGSILLDEIGDMPPPLQAKLLHVLQDQEFSRLGATHAIRVNSRILATTNKRMELAVSRGEFREDLFYRLNVVRLEVPPLREHLKDVPALCDFFREKYMARYCGNEQVELPARLQEVFCSYRWPGNVRQLENAVKQFLILREEELVLQSLAQSATGTEPEQPFASPPASNEELPSLKSEWHSLKHIGVEAAERAEKEIVFRTLNESHWNRKKVARELGISYKTLLTKLQRWESREAS